MERRRRGLSITRLKNTNFDRLYKRLITGESISEEEYRKLLALAVLFINDADSNINKLGYRIIVLYSNRTNDYKPLYDIAINKGLYPIVKSIERIEKYNERIENSFFKLFQSAFIDNYKKNDVYLTEQQNNLIDFYKEKENETVSIVAPTSYGKSSLILSTIEGRKSENICIIVPSKALIAQTKKRLLQSGLKNIDKIITHPEMYLESDKNIVAILTQERLLKLLKIDDKLKFDIVIVDEAHNLLEKDQRNILLASSLSILEKRNSDVKFRFLTPFLVDSSNLSVRYTEYSIESFNVTEYLKTELIYICDFRKGKEPNLKLYDQFLNEFYSINQTEFKSDVDLIIKNSSEKNIIYLNKPKDIEEFLSKFISQLNDVTSNRIDKACKSIGEILDPNYLLIDSLRKGVVYHHGYVPDNIKLYIEELYSELDDIKYIVTTSTLLEGVNIPAYTLFLLDYKKGTKKLSSSKFKNLLGRICRFNEIFSPKKGDLKYLEPKVYLIASSYIAKNANLETFIEEIMNVQKKDKDIPENVLLKTVDITGENDEAKKSADQFIENFERGVIDNYKYSYAKTPIGKLCFENKIMEVDVVSNETEMQKKFESLNKTLVSDSVGLIKLFTELFLPFLDEKESKLSRLTKEKAREFYIMFLNWRIKNSSYREMISSFLNYWKSLEKRGLDTDVYVGSKWGDKTKFGGRQKLWTNIKQKSHEERVNLAIVRIKEENDFIDHHFMKYVEVMNDLGLIDQKFYNLIKYGTNNQSKITLIRNGLSLTLANLLMEKYQNYFVVNNNQQTVELKPELIKAMDKNEENDILIHEVKFNLSR